jgi:hypothetical protein
LARAKPGPKTASDRRAQAGLSADEEWTRAAVKLLLDACHPKQRQFAEDRHRRVSALVGRGGGKTTGWKAKALRDMLEIRRAKLVYIALSRPHAEELLWEPLKFTVDELHRAIGGFEVGQDVFFHEQKLKMTLVRTGAELKLVGADDKAEIEKLRGKPFHRVGLDEAGSHQNKLVWHLLYKAVGPRLGDYRGAFDIFGSPGEVPDPSGEFWLATHPDSTRHRRYEDRHNPEFADWVGWSSHAWSLEDPEAQKLPALANVWAEALLTKRDNGWSDDNPIWRREYLGQWARDNTANIYQFVAERDTWDPKRDPTSGFAELPEGFKDWSYGYGVDMGSKDPFALNIFAFSPSDPTRTLYHVFTFGKTGMYARLIATVMLGEETVAGILRGENLDYERTEAGTFAVTGWPTAIVADLAHLGQAIIDELAQVYGIRIKAAEKKGKYSAIEGVNGDLHDGRIKILKGSVLAEQLERLQWQVDEFGLVKEGKGDRNDHTDSLVYIRREIVGLFASGVLAENSRGAGRDAASPATYRDPAGPGDELEQAGEFDALLSDPEFGTDWWGNT